MPVPAVERKLAAIFAADIAGYSRLMGADEEGTLERLKARREIMDRLIAAHRGRIVKTAGDGVVVDFASVVDAVQCAVAVQEALAKENAGMAESEAMRSDAVVGYPRGRSDPHSGRAVLLDDPGRYGGRGDQDRNPGRGRSGAPARGDARRAELVFRGVQPQQALVDPEFAQRRRPRGARKADRAQRCSGREFPTRGDGGNGL